MSSNPQNSDSDQSNQDPHQYSPQILFELFRKSAEDAEKRAKDFEKEMKEREAEAKKRAEEFKKEMQERSEEFEREMKEREEKREQEKKEREQEREKERKEMNRYIKSVEADVSGMKKSIGKEVEEFFASSLEKKQRLGSTQFDVAERNMKRRTPEGESIEIDFFMENGNAVGIVEIKHKVQRKHIDQLDKIIAKFKKIYPFYKDYKIVGAIAGKIITQEIKNLALKKGYFVLKQQGDHIETIPPQSLEM